MHIWEVRMYNKGDVMTGFVRCETRTEACRLALQNARDKTRRYGWEIEECTRFSN